MAVLPDDVRRVHGPSEFRDLIENCVEWLIFGCASDILLMELLRVREGLLLGIVRLKSDEGADWLRVLLVISFVSDFLVDLLVELEHFFIAHGFDHLTSILEEPYEVLIVIGKSDVADMYFVLWVDVRVENLVEHLFCFCLRVQFHERGIETLVLRYLHRLLLIECLIIGISFAFDGDLLVLAEDVLDLLS